MTAYFIARLMTLIILIQNMKLAPIFLRNILSVLFLPFDKSKNVVGISNSSLYILSLSFFRQLGCRNSTKLVPLVQELGQQIHLFLAEYNRYNSDANLHVNGHSNLNLCENLEGATEADATPHINLPGFRRRNKNKW